MPLENTFVNKFVTVLAQVPMTTTFDGRNRLLGNLPTDGLTRNENMRWLDLKDIVEQLDRLGRIKSTGVRPLIVVAQNALDSFRGWDNDLTTTLKEIIEELDNYYGDEMHLPLDMYPIPPLELEALPFNGYDERLSTRFLEEALHTGRSVARLQVPHIFNGNQEDGKACCGTGWIIAPGLLITNHHVIAARCEKDDPQDVSLKDFKLQAEKTIVWFDYRHEGGSYLECRGAALVCFSKALDYALIRLNEEHKIADRQPLHLIQQQPTLRRGKRLNIPQHSGGGPLLYAIRNNFYAGSGNSSLFLHYLTDTEQGASGSPVLGDDWMVLALHHASIRLSQRYDMHMQGRSREEIARFNNEGIAIHSILADLPTEVRQEIDRAQGWGL